MCLCVVCTRVWDSIKRGIIRCLHKNITESKSLTDSSEHERMYSVCLPNLGSVMSSDTHTSTGIHNPVPHRAYRKQYDIKYLYVATLKFGITFCENCDLVDVRHGIRIVTVTGACTSLPNVRPMHKFHSHRWPSAHAYENPLTLSLSLSLLTINSFLLDQVQVVCRVV